MCDVRQEQQLLHVFQWKRCHQCVTWCSVLDGAPCCVYAHTVMSCRNRRSVLEASWQVVPLLGRNWEAGGSEVLEFLERTCCCTPCWPCMCMPESGLCLACTCNVCA
jgi:hypothetical protein